ncbi:putative disease resistance protein RGA3 isoform X1 [Elaeis guineensis]|uniref:putative disease resistance protein RGA3 isoform X1 n=1 Tax=Elaeis guineensis var. tenera TaxID=51953 RepID=UPI003C6DA682
MAMILDAFVYKFAQLLVELANEEVDMLLGVPGEIKKLQNKLRKISKVLADAERKRINDEAIDDWLKELKDFMYDADDILDLCRIEADKCSEGSSSTSSVCSPFPLLSCFRKPLLSHEIGSKIRELNLKLEQISRGRSEFNLQNSSPDKQKVTSQNSRKTSPVGEIDIVGSEIEEHTQSLVDLLIKDDTRGNNLVFAIVGAGGIGKTTLAKRIYNDQRIQEEFSKKRWVCVSQEFDEVKLLKDILDGDKNDCAGDQSKSSLEPKVETSLWGKKLFLVLDDVWTAKVWCDLLCNTLKSCAAGSRILVTTRNEQITKQMRAVNTHQVHKLSLKDSWLLLCKKVVLIGEEGEIQHLKDIGMEMVKKCDGLPLAIKAVAGVLCTKERTRRAWSGVLESTAWSTSGLPEEVKGALYLSYEDLPSYLKQCFIYCSLFPENHQIWMDTITKLWIAEGFVKAEGSSTMEEIAEDYYKELIMRNLLQPHAPYICQMHDLLQSLARYLARDESSVVCKVDEVGSSNGPMKLRRVFVSNVHEVGTSGPTTAITDVLVKKDTLRTLMWNMMPMSETQMDVIFHKLSRLRVLDMSHSRIRSLPDSLGNLIHLRYLNISFTQISMIPETIGNVRNLQFLEIQGCQHLSRLPNSIVKLHNLRSLRVNFTKVVEMPAGLGRLQNLHTLWELNLPSNRAKGWCTIEELRSLSCLTDLSIGRLECISSSSEARAAELRNKSKLSSLELHCTPVLHPSKEKMKRIEEVFEEIHPPPSVEQLQIVDYFGREFPKWMPETSSSTSILFPNLRQLVLNGYRYCERFPPWGLLPNLQYLFIRHADSVMDVGPEFLVGTSSTSSDGGRAAVDTSKYAFPRLETLMFRHMSNWQEWHWEKGTEAMPCLKDLYLDNCPKLMSLPEGLLLHATSLTKLEISFADSLTTIENLLSLKELHVKYNPNLEKISNLPALTTLAVNNCPKLKVVENLRYLKRMKLIDYAMKSLPSYLLKGVHTPHLEELEIWCSMELIRNICESDSREWQIIQGIQQVHVYSQDELVHALYNQSPFSFTTNLNTTTTSSSSKMPSSSSGTAL